MYTIPDFRAPLFGNLKEGFQLSAIGRQPDASCCAGKRLRRLAVAVCGGAPWNFGTLPMKFLGREFSGFWNTGRAKEAYLAGRRRIGCAKKGEFWNMESSIANMIQKSKNTAARENEGAEVEGGGPANERRASNQQQSTRKHSMRLSSWRLNANS